MVGKYSPGDIVKCDLSKVNTSFYAVVIRPRNPLGSSHKRFYFISVLGNNKQREIIKREILKEYDYLYHLRTTNVRSIVLCVSVNSFTKSDKRLVLSERSPFIMKDFY